MNAVGGHLRRHMQRHEKTIMQQSGMGYAMLDKNNAIIKVEPAKGMQIPGQANSPGMQGSPMFAIQGGQLQGQLLSPDGSGFGMMQGQMMSPMKQAPTPRFP